MAVPASGAGHRQARQLPGGAPTADAQRGAPPVEVSKQPGGKLASTDPDPGTSDEKVHLSRACTTVSVRVQWDIAALSTRPSPAARRRIPLRNDRTVHHLERGHGRDHRRLTDRTGDPPAARSNHARTTGQLQQVDGAWPGVRVAVEEAGGCWRLRKLSTRRSRVASL